MRSKINQILAEMSPVGSEFSEKSNLKIDLGIDSLRISELVVALENAFGIFFAPEDMELAKLATVRDLYRLMRRYVHE